MLPDRTRQVLAAFDAALQLEGSERAAYLDELAAADPELRDQVLRLLQTHEQLGADFMKTPAAGLESFGTVLGAKRLEPKTPFGPYVIERLIGAGGMGEVYLARDQRLQRPVALKLLTGLVGRDAQMVRRFTQEALTVSALNHPNILVVYEAGEIDARSYIASEFVAGTPLHELLREGPLPWRRSVGIALDVARALEAAHRAGVIHRDVKPGNILVGEEDRVKLVDFGIAKLAAGADPGPAFGTPRTATGFVVGTPGYMSPEQAAGLPVDHRSDLWSLAAVLHEMVTGRLPPPGLAQCRAGRNLPSSLAGVLEHALQARVESRYQSAGELVAALTRSLSAWRGSRRTRRIAAAVAAVVAALTLGILWWRQSAIPGQTAVRRTIAVLPFDNIGVDPGDAFYTVGIQDEVWTHLAKISGLRVISRHASAGYASRPASLRDVSSVLRAGTVLEGSVQKQGDRLRVTVQLIDTETNATLWAESYDRTATDIFDVEGDIAESVAGQLRARLLPAERVSVETADTRSPQAHTAEMLGRFHMARREEQSLRKAIDYFHEAIELDPRYALAYADLSTALYDLVDSIDESAAGTLKAQARAAAAQSLRLAPDLAEGHLALGWVLLYYDWDLAGAQREMALAAGLAPNSARAKNGLATLYGVRGDFDRALKLMNEARALDPVSSGFAVNTASFLIATGRYAEAQDLSRRAVELDPAAPLAHRNLALIALARGDTDAARREAQLETDQGFKDLLVTILRQDPRRGAEADSALHEFIARNAKDSPFLVGCVYAFRDEPDRAFEWLDRAYAAHDDGTTDFMESPFFARLRADPRYAAFEKKLGINPPARL